MEECRMLASQQDRAGEEERLFERGGMGSFLLLSLPGVGL